jgi:hypothetical protein
MPAYDINSIIRAITFRHAEAKKEHLSGEVIVRLNFNNGEITRARYETEGPLEPGDRGAKLAPPPFDVPGKNRG